MDRLEVRAPKGEFWSGKRVLITGVTGFKGSWMALWLARLGSSVSGFSLAPPTEPNLFQAANIGSCVQSFEGDIRDLEAVRNCVAQCRPEIIIHMAAQSLVRRSYADPVGTYATNVMGTVNVLEAALKSGVQLLLNVTSDKCYENREVIWGYREGDPLGGFDPYSSSKACSELVASAYRQSFGRTAQLRIASARAGNVIGGGDWADDRLVPDCIRALSRKEVIIVRRPDAVRPWQHVLEPVSGYLTYVEHLANRCDAPNCLNFGPSDSDVRSVGDVVSGITKRWAPDASWRIERSDSLHEAGLLTLDSTLARRSLGWRPRWNLDQALDHTVEWYRRFHAHSRMETFTLDQISMYERTSTGAAA